MFYQNETSGIPLNIQVHIDGWRAVLNRPIVKRVDANIDVTSLGRNQQAIITKVIGPWYPQKTNDNNATVKAHYLYANGKKHPSKTGKDDGKIPPSPIHEDKSNSDIEQITLQRAFKRRLGEAQFSFEEHVVIPKSTFEYAP